MPWHGRDSKQCERSNSASQKLTLFGTGGGVGGPGDGGGVGGGGRGGGSCGPIQASPRNLGLNGGGRGVKQPGLEEGGHCRGIKRWGIEGIRIGSSAGAEANCRKYTPEPYSNYEGPYSTNACSRLFAIVTSGNCGSEFTCSARCDNHVNFCDVLCVRSFWLPVLCWLQTLISSACCELRSV